MPRLDTQTLARSYALRVHTESETQQTPGFQKNSVGFHSSFGRFKAPSTLKAIGYRRCFGGPRSTQPTGTTGTIYLRNITYVKYTQFWGRPNLQADLGIRC